jgi:hypothetical protein
MADERFAYIWEYEVPPSQEAEFLAHYAPAGEWAQLFRRSAEYVATELYRDRARPERFLTIDHWRTENGFREFRRRFAAEFEELDRRCAAFTRHEALLGEFRPATSNVT